VKLTRDEVQGHYDCVREVLVSRQRNGQPIPEWMHRIHRRLFAELRLSPTRQDGAASTAGATHLDSDNWIGSRQVAEMSGWQLRQAQRLKKRLKKDLDYRKVSGRLWFRESAVREYLEGLNDDRVA
jgi:hypothetical protein